MRLKKLVAWNMLMVLALGATVWQGRVSWHQAQAKRRRFLIVDVTPIRAPELTTVLTPVPLPDAAVAMKYAGIATMDLFTQDRNPNVIIDRPKAEEPKKMPPLPVAYGVLGLRSGAKAIMSEKAGLPSVSVQTGDTIGEFRIVSLDTQNVTFAWDGKMISRRIEDLIDRSNGAVPSSVQAARVPSIGTSVRPLAQDSEPDGRSTLPCVAGDNSPEGTVAGRYKKGLERTAQGTVCNWVRVQ